MRLADVFRARVVDTTLESFVFEITGAPDKVDAFIALMRPLGRVDVARTGVSGDGPRRRVGFESGEGIMAARTLPDLVGELSKTFNGHLLQPADAGYEEARKVHNGLIDKRPALIARCRGVADVVDAVELARKLGLESRFAAAATTWRDAATIDGGLMIDLAPMKGIHVDPQARAARAQGGVTWASSTAKPSCMASPSPAAWSRRPASPA